MPPPSATAMQPHVRLAHFPDDRNAVEAIFREYVHSPTADLGFQDFETEFAALPGPYAHPEGCVLLACTPDGVLGCAALRRVAADPLRCELKRVYVRPAGRNLGLGRLLVQRMLEEARLAGYRRMHLDVLPEFQAAQALYVSLGFVDAEPISFNPVPGTRFMALDL